MSGYIPDLQIAPTRSYKPQADKVIDFYSYHLFAFYSTGHDARLVLVSSANGHSIINHRLEFVTRAIVVAYKLVNVCGQPQEAWALDLASINLDHDVRQDLSLRAPP